MNKTILITGANSFIVKHLLPILENEYNIKLLTRTPRVENEYAWDLEKWTMDEEALDGVNYIIHLAGSKLNDGSPLTPERKKLVYDTRIGAADFLRQKLNARGQKLAAFVSASAIGYYGYTDNTLEIGEDGERGVGFNADLCDDWEKAADMFKLENVAEHVSKIRVSLVLGRDGGILPVYEEMVTRNPAVALQPNGSSYPWNHVADMAGIFAYAMKNELDGVYNSVAPHPASVQDVLKAVANNIADTDYPIHPFKGRHLVSHKIINAGYQFKYPDIEKAMANLFAQ